MSKALEAAVIAADALDIPDGDIRTVRFSDRQVSATPSPAPGWRDIKSAPTDGTVIEVEVDPEDFDRPFLIKREPGFMNCDGDDCWSWVAVKDGEHPPCWSGGAYWDSNEDEMPSTPPLRWRPPLSPTTEAGHDDR